VGVCAVVALALSLSPYILGSKAQDAGDKLGSAQHQASLGENLANKISIACSNPTVLPQLRALGACEAAVQVKQTPVVGENGANGQNGTNGVNGRGITNTYVTNGHMFVTYTDNSTMDLGIVVGKDGTNGKDGAKGSDGTNGRGIVSSALGGSSGTDLIITYTDGTTNDVGNVVGSNGKDGANGVEGVNGANGTDGANGSNGADGKDGVDGASGRGVLTVTINSASHLIVTYTDGTSDDVGLLPAGPQGVGVQSVSLENDPSGNCQLVFTLLNPANGQTSTQDVQVNQAVCQSSTATTTTTEPAPTS
jgi:hypothetical protein